MMINLCNFSTATQWLKAALLFMGIAMGLAACTNTPGQETGVFNVRDFGATGDGTTLETAAFQEALDATSEAGGKLLVPKGKYLIGTIYLKDNSVLELLPGATLLGSTNLADYDSLYWGHNQDRTPYHLIVAQNAKNVTIQGRGTIDGQGKNWYNYTDVKPRWMQKQIRRPSPMVEFDHCENVRVTGITLTHAAGWTLHAFNSDHIVVDGIRLVNNLYGPNNDGIDVTGCNNVMISNCYIKTCDDAVCVKTTTDSRTSSNVTVTNCIMQTTCVALKCGETSKRISGLTLSNCVITESSRAFGIYATWGGDVENVNVSNIVANTNAPLVLNRPFQISAWDAYSREGAFLRKGGNVRNVTVSNFTATTQGRILITANHDKRVENINLRDIRLAYPYIENPADYASEATSNQFRGIEAGAMTANAAVVASNVRNLTLDGLSIDWNQSDTIPQEWQHPERIENGKMDKVHYPAYDRVKMTEFHAFYGNNIEGGYLFAPMAKASAPGLPAFVTKGSDLQILSNR